MTMPLAALTLAAALQPCAAGVAPRTMAAIVRVESGGWPLAVHDDTTGRGYVFDDRARAEATASALLAAGHVLDLGVAQINSGNLRALGLDVHASFDACANLRAGSILLRRAYASASARFGPGQIALRHALSAYNSGSFFAAPAYVDRVVAASGIVR